MIRPLLLITLIAFFFNSRAQNLDTKVLKAVQTVYNQYKLFFDSSLLDKHVILDTKKSYLVNSQTQKIKTLAIADNSFAFDEFSLSFAVVYKGDTITHLPACRLDTFQNLMALGTPSNPLQHGDLLPPYQQLVKGNIKFDYKKLQALLQDMKLQVTAVKLQKASARADAGKNSKQQYNWLVTTACPNLKCKDVLISATSGKVQAD